MAGPPSPGKTAGSPPPATIVIVPLDTFPILPEPAMYRLPAESTATPKGRIDPPVAGPWSVIMPRYPFPATVVIVPFETSRTRKLIGSPM